MWISHKVTKIKKKLKNQIKKKYKMSQIFPKKRTRKRMIKVISTIKDNFNSKNKGKIWSSIQMK